MAPRQQPLRHRGCAMRLESLLATWHSWRAGYTPARGYARARFEVAGDAPDDDDLDAMLMEEVEQAINELPQLHQLALQHIARREHLGIEVMKVARLPVDPAQREAICAQAVAALRRKLLALGLM